MIDLYLWAEDPCGHQADPGAPSSGRFRGLLEARAHALWGARCNRIFVWLARDTGCYVAADGAARANDGLPEEIRAAWLPLVADTYAEGAWVAPFEVPETRVVKRASARLSERATLLARIAHLKRQLRWARFSNAFESGGASTWMPFDAPCDPAVDGLGGLYEASASGDARLLAECLREYASRAAYHDARGSHRELRLTFDAAERGES